MRYDLIDLQGVFKIDGTVGAEKTGVGYNNGTVDWIPSFTTSPESIFLNENGYNYFIVEANGTPQENAQKLIEALVSYQSMTGQPDIDNRYSILLTPGEYDFNGLTTMEIFDYMDLVGLCNDPFKVILRNSGGGILFDASNVDYGLENLYLYGDGYLTLNGGYPRWKNVAFGGITFWNGDPWVVVRGEYRDIQIVDNCLAFCSSSLIDNAIFENIKAKSVQKIFVTTQDITGTFSNIFIENITGNESFAANATITANIENVEIKNSPTTKILSARGVYAEMKNIRIKNCNIFINTNATGFFGDITNLTIEDSIGFFYDASIVSNAVSNMKNITIRNVQNVLSSNFNGELMNVTITNCVNVLENSFTGNARNMTVLNCTNFLYCSSISGHFENINTLNCDNCFYSTLMYITVNNSTFKGTGTRVFDGDNGILFSKMKNIKIENYNSAFNTGIFELEVSNFEFTTVGEVFSAQDGIWGTFSDIYGGNVNNFITSNDIVIKGYFYDIQIGNVNTDSFRGNLESNVDGLIVGNINGDFFINTIIQPSGEYRNIKSGNCLSDAFVFSSFNDPTLVIENIEIGDVGQNLFTTPDKINANFQNIKANSVSGNVFETPYADLIEGEITISGWFKDIDIKSCDKMFKNSASIYSSINDIRVENLRIGSCNDLQVLVSVGSQSVFRNLNIKGDWTPNGFAGSLENCFIDKRAYAQSGIPSTLLPSVFKRSKILSIDTKPPDYVSKTVYLSSFNYFTGEDSDFYNRKHNILDVDVE